MATSGVSLLLLLAILTALVAEISAEKHLIFVSLSADNYYKNFVDNIAKFANDLADQAGEDDQVIVLYPWQWKHQAPRREYRMSKNARCIYVNETIDLWTRDFGFVNPARPFKFKYEPRRYVSVADAQFVDGEFRRFLGGLGIVQSNISHSSSNVAYLSNDQLVEDGGNIVDNHFGRAILSERFFENSNFSNIKPRQNLIRALEQSINASVLFIPDPGDTTGHADGIVSFIESDTLLIADYANRTSYATLRDLVNQTFPDLKTVRIPCLDVNVSAWKGRSAVGVYVNILYTDSSLYVPTFGREVEDARAVDIIKANIRSGRKVKTVNTARLSGLGGSIRCMTMQLKFSTLIAQKLYAASVPCISSKGDAYKPILLMILLSSATICLSFLQEG